MVQNDVKHWRKTPGIAIKHMAGHFGTRSTLAHAVQEYDEVLLAIQNEILMSELHWDSPQDEQSFQVVGVRLEPQIAVVVINFVD